MGASATGTDALLVSDRDRLLRAMAELCAEVGYRNTTVDAVAERAEVDAERFHGLFAGMEDCALAAFRQFVSEALARVSTGPSPRAAEPGLASEQVRALVDLLVALPAFGQLASIEARHGGTASLRADYASALHILALMMERLGAGARAGGHGLRARVALGSIEAVARRELATGRAAGLPRLIPDFVYAALVPFVGQREALRQAKAAADAVAEEG